MARRRTPPRRRRPVSLPPALRRIETGPDGYDYEVRPVAAARAVKTYRCPGCDHEICSGTAHVVVWLAESPAAGGARRDCHNPSETHPARRAPDANRA